MRIKPQNSLSILIDAQERLFPHMHDSEALLKKIGVLIGSLKALNVPIMLTEQYKKGLGNTLPDIIEYFGNNLPEGVMRPEKKHFSVLDHESAAAEIHRRSPKHLILFGIERHVCVLQTAIDAVEAGFHPIVVTDATSSRFEHDKEMALERMKMEGVHLATVESLAFELCRVSGTETFKTISKLVK